MIVIDLHGINKDERKDYISDYLNTLDFSSSDNHLAIITINIEKNIIDEVINILDERKRTYKILPKKILVCREEN